MANRRQDLRPKDPTTLDFDLEADHVPDGFFRGTSCRVNGHRHLIFAIDYQIRLLSRARTLYMDGTFKIVGEFLSSSVCKTVVP